MAVVDSTRAEGYTHGGFDRMVGGCGRKSFSGKYRLGLFNARLIFHFRYF